MRQITKAVLRPCSLPAAQSVESVACRTAGKARHSSLAPPMVATSRTLKLSCVKAALENFQSRQMERLTIAAGSPRRMFASGRGPPLIVARSASQHHVAVASHASRSTLDDVKRRASRADARRALVAFRDPSRASRVSALRASIPDAAAKVRGSCWTGAPNNRRTSLWSNQI